MKVCFVCTGNSCRSQMAEGFAKKLLGKRAEIYSAGSKPLGYILPKTTQVMNEKGIDISAQRSKSIDEVPIQAMDYVITLCDSAAQYCPTTLARGQKLHWSFPDPYDPMANKDEATTLKDFRAVRDVIEKKLKEWLTTL